MGTIKRFKSLDKLEEIKIPRVKLLDGSYMEYEDYKNRFNNTPSNNSNIIEISGDLLPF